MSPDDWSTLIASVLTAAGTLIGMWAMAGKTRAETAMIRAEIADMRAGLVTDHGSTSPGDAIDRITETLSGVTEAQVRQESATVALTSDMAATRSSLGGLRDDMRGLRSETSDRVSELADRLTAEADRQSTHERTCPARLPLTRAIHHPTNPLQED